MELILWRIIKNAGDLETKLKSDLEHLSFAFLMGKTQKANRIGETKSKTGKHLAFDKVKDQYFGHKISCFKINQSLIG
jgi:hypothetical protein